MLRALRGRAHTVCTAFCITRTGSNSQTVTDAIFTTVHMRNYSDDEIEVYIASGDPFDKAGSYAIQHPGFRPVKSIEGCYSNVVGLPLCAVKRALHRIGWPGIIAAQGCDCTVFVVGAS
jgi:septum formation protein